jgi:hypothetical protein
MAHAKMNDDFKHYLLKNMLKREDNIYHAEKMFVAMSVLRWVFEQKVTDDVRAKYFSQIDKYLANEIDLYWEDGIIRYKTLKPRGKS